MRGRARRGQGNTGKQWTGRTRYAFLFFSILLTICALQHPQLHPPAPKHVERALMGMFYMFGMFFHLSPPQNMKNVPFWHVFCVWHHLPPSRQTKHTYTGVFCLPRYTLLPFLPLNMKNVPFLVHFSCSIPFLSIHQLPSSLPLLSCLLNTQNVLFSARFLHLVPTPSAPSHPLALNTENAPVWPHFWCPATTTTSSHPPPFPP